MKSGKRSAKRSNTGKLERESSLWGSRRRKWKDNVRVRCREKVE